MSSTAYRRARDARIVEAYIAGASQLELARSHGLTRRQIGNIVRRAGLRFNPGERLGRRGRNRIAKIPAALRARYRALRNSYGADFARREVAA